MHEESGNLRFQWFIAALAVILFISKIIAWKITDSVAILTDALESIVNITAAFIGIYSIYISGKPRDMNHPYGHGKVEFLTSAVEGVFICCGGIAICISAIQRLFKPEMPGELDKGILIVLASAIINFIAGYYSVAKGKRSGSAVLIAGGRHLQADTWSTLGITAGLILLLVTGKAWIDSVTALVFSSFIIYTGYGIMRRSVAGIMDEADEKLLVDVVEYLNEVRRENWIDLHKLRIIKYGSVLHLDCHLTVPWYINVNQAHDEVEHLSSEIRKRFGKSVELFVHTDGCMDFSCRICIKGDCSVRQHALNKRLVWTVENARQDKKHDINTGDHR